MFFFKQKTAYEKEECDWSSDVCSSNLERDLDLDLVGVDALEGGGECASDHQCKALEQPACQRPGLHPEASPALPGRNGPVRSPVGFAAPSQETG